MNINMMDISFCSDTWMPSMQACKCKYYATEGLIVTENLKFTSHLQILYFLYIAFIVRHPQGFKKESATTFFCNFPQY